MCSDVNRKFSIVARKSQDHTSGSEAVSIPGANRVSNLFAKRTKRKTTSITVEQAQIVSWFSNYQVV